MSDPTAQLADFRRYASLLEPALLAPYAFTPTVESATAVQVERGLVFPRCLVRRSFEADDAPAVERLIEVTRAGGDVSRLAVVDAAGHHRPAYRGLLVYSWLQAYRLVYETLPQSEFGRWEEALRAWCDLLESELGQIPLPDTGTPASRGDRATEAAWTALALHVAGKVFVRDAWTDLASDLFGRLTRGQHASGAFLTTSASDNPETHWYHELVILHAAASYAVQAEDRTVAAAVRRATAFHLNETQPDHASTQPWGVFAFVWNPETRLLADQLLHASNVQQPASLGGVPLMLLGDALYCLRLFL